MGAKQRVARGNSGRKTEIPFLWWVGAAGVALFMLIFPYDRGMFNGYEISFERTINSGIIYSFLLLLAPAVYLIRKWRLNSHVGILSIVVLLVPLIYWLSSLNAVSGYYATVMALIYGALAGLLIVSLYSAQATRTRLVIESGMMLSGGIIVLFGLLNLFGQIYVRDALWLAHDGYRLTSVFQYSNTYAGYLIALFLAAVYYAVHGARASVRLAAAAMLAPIWLSFMLTYSRGALVVIPVIILLILPFMRPAKQVAYMLYMAAAVAVTMLVLGKISANTAQIAEVVQPTAEKAPNTISLFSALPLQSWGLLLLAAAVTTAVIWLYHAKLAGWVESRLEKLAGRKLSYFFLPVVIVVAGVLVAALLLSSSAVRSLLPDQLAERLASINFQQHSVLERITFYKDGLNVAKDFPLLGAGGGAWQAVYEEYQNNPYESRQAHSFYIQVLVEVGWIGLLALLGLFGYIYFLYVRSYIRYPEERGSHFVFFIISLSLLLHSAIDFDMSYVYIAALVFISLGCLLAPFNGKLTIERLDNAIPPKSWQGAAYPGVLAAVSIAMLVATIQNNRAVVNFNNTVAMAAQQQTGFFELIDKLDESIAISPDQPAYSVTKANWLIQGFEQNQDESLLQLASDTLEAAGRHDSYNRGIFVYKIRLLELQNDTEALLPVIEETLVKFPWDISFYETAMTNYAAARMTALASQDTATAEQYASRIREIRDEVQRRIELLATLPEEQQQGRNFSFTEPMNTAFGSLD